MKPGSAQLRSLGLIHFSTCIPHFPFFLALSALCGRGVRKIPESSTSLGEIHMSLRASPEGFSWGDVEARFVLNSLQCCLECFWVVCLEARMKEYLFEGRDAQWVNPCVHRYNTCIKSPRLWHWSAGHSNNQYKNLEEKSNHVSHNHYDVTSMHRAHLVLNHFLHKL